VINNELVTGGVLFKEKGKSRHIPNKRGPGLTPGSVRKLPLI